VAEIMIGGHQTEGFDELRESVRALVSILAQRNGKTGYLASPDRSVSTTFGHKRGGRKGAAC
jgi:hypothetical protein